MLPIKLKGKKKKEEKEIFSEQDALASEALLPWQKQKVIFAAF